MLQSWDSHDETRGVFQADLAAVSPRNPTANRQPEPASRTVAGAHQSIEHAVSNLARNAGTVVVDDDGGEVAFRAHGDADAGVRVTNGVVEQVAHDLRDAPLVGFGEDRSRLEIDAGGAFSTGVLPRDAGDGITDVDRLALELLGTAGTRQKSEVTHQARSIDRGVGYRFESRAFRITRIDRGLLRYARYRSERRAQLVRDVGGEIAFAFGGSLKGGD